MNVVTSKSPNWLYIQDLMGKSDGVRFTLKDETSVEVNKVRWGFGLFHKWVLVETNQTLSDQEVADLLYNMVYNTALHLTVITLKEK